ncbi:MAG: hypothetical protein COA44_01660 [Arcobacter sp.]|nr:MAG: hypothetical protein COA44_01660 [Arcobacter sp.]
MQNKILIVDDNEVNLELITLLIQQYTKEKKIDLQVITAENGQEAIDACVHGDIDIIFMDLMMPTMNGNEATKIIKANHPHAMVIVISALGDEGRQKEMLLNGAEDYMTKPVNGPLFKSRLHNYLQLIQTRNHISHLPKTHNLFTSKVYNYHMDFFISSEADLSEFWEAFLIRLDFQRHIEDLSDFIRFIYRFGSLQLNKGYQFHIFIEEDADNFYFTLDNIQLLGSEKVNTIVQKYYKEGLFLCEANHLSFILAKTSLQEVNILVQEKVKSEEPAKVIPIMSTQKDQELQTFDILDTEELEDFEDHLLKLKSLILLMENSKLEAEDIQNLCHSLKETASILSIPNDTYVLSNALQELTHAIQDNQEYFHESSEQLFDFINAFIHDLIFWKNKIFYEGAPSVSFLNDSITSNANMLNALLQPQDNAISNEDVDDIFDF